MTLSPTAEFIYHNPNYGDFALAYRLALKKDASLAKLSSEHGGFRLVSIEEFRKIPRYQADPISVLIDNHISVNSWKL